MEELPSSWNGLDGDISKQNFAYEHDVSPLSEGEDSTWRLNSTVETHMPHKHLHDDNVLIESNGQAVVVVEDNNHSSHQHSINLEEKQPKMDYTILIKDLNGSWDDEVSVLMQDLRLLKLCGCCNWLQVLLLIKHSWEMEEAFRTCLSVSQSELVCLFITTPCPILQVVAKAYL